MHYTYSLVSEFKKRHPFTIAWRIKAHSKLIDEYLNPGEEILYGFAGQKNDKAFNIISSCVVVLTNKRILVVQKRLLFGFFIYSITPDMYNDLTVTASILWGKIHIDTVKELITISKLSKKSLDEIETHISEYMMDQKKSYTITNTRN